MFSIDLSAKCTDLKGTEYDETYGQVIADIVLSKGSDGPVVTMMKWAFDLNVNKPISINKRDREMLRGLVESHRLLCNYIKLYVMNALDEAVEAKDAVPESA